VIVSEKVKSGGEKGSPPRQNQTVPQTQLIRRPVTAIRKRPKRQSFADGVKSLLKAIKSML
jgi:hypothetical protein